MSILQGPVAFIDDEIADSSKAAFAMKNALEANGRPVIAFDALPDTAAMEHWRSLSFLVLDWDLSHGSLGGLGATELSEFDREALLDFLADFMGKVFCPVFIISAERTEGIERSIKEDDRFATASVLDTRIRILSKSVVADDLLAHLEDWVEGNLALSVFKVWEQEYDLAKNRMFIDFNRLESSWPSYVWRNALEDKVEPAFELAATLTANLLHRIDLVKFDTETMLSGEHPPLSTVSMRKVTNGRTVIPRERLHDNVVMPGDMFLDPGDTNVIWLNLSPACHTVPGRLEDGEDMRLFSVPGRKQVPPPSSKKFRDVFRESPNTFAIHALHDDSAYVFELKQARFLVWADVSSRRVGRLLAPYITRAQQANAMFMLMEGVPRASFDMLYKESSPSQ